MRILTVAASAAVLGIAATGNASSPPLAAIASVAGSVDGVAQDGPWVGWLIGDGYEGCDRVALRNMVTGATFVIQQRTRKDDRAFCSRVFSPGDLALAGSHALWSARGSGH